MYRYIELNPVRAGMVAHPQDYIWSSYQINALGRSLELCQLHAFYLALGNDPEHRQKHYQALVSEGLSSDQLITIRNSVNKACVLGNECFSNQITALTGKRLPTGKVGRQLGWRKLKDMK